MIRRHPEVKEKSMILGVRTQHDIRELRYLEGLLLKEKPVNIVEIGTGRGGLSLLFALHAQINLGSLVTVDVAPVFIPNNPTIYNSRTI